MKTLYYIGIESEGVKERHKGRERKHPIAIYRHIRHLSLENGSICLYHSLLPTFFEEEMQKKRWRKKWLMRLEEAERFAREKLNARLPEEIVFSQRLGDLMGSEREIPLFLFAAGLKRLKNSRSFAHISISLPEECSPITAESMVELLHPYLSKINYVVFVGEETENSVWVEDYLYEEYGIVMSYGKRPEKNTVWLDLEEKRASAMEEFAVSNGICRLGRKEILKFLDTMIKSEYNTKIN